MIDDLTHAILGSHQQADQDLPFLKLSVDERENIGLDKLEQVFRHCEKVNKKEMQSSPAILQVIVHAPAAYQTFPIQSCTNSHRCHRPQKIQYVPVSIV